MSTLKCQIKIIGAGIAGLWLFNRLKTLGYDALLITDENGIGHGQTIASQGILHSGLKYAIAGKVNDLAKSISQMPDRWRNALNSKGDIDLANATINASNQQLMIPDGVGGKLVEITTKKTLGDTVSKGTSPYPDFKGTTLDMGEMVLDIPSVIRALAEPYIDCIRNVDPDEIDSDITIYTAAKTNKIIAEKNSFKVETQHRPLLMVMVKNAPFDLFAHFVGSSEKPVATVTTHYDENGTRIWYLGGQIAERAKEDDPQNAYKDVQKAFEKYLPNLDTSEFEYAFLPIDRVEGKAEKKNWLPDLPVIRRDENTLYCWPTKLTFAPLLSDFVLEEIDFDPAQAQSDFSHLKPAHYAQPPWDTAQWKKMN